MKKSDKKIVVDRFIQKATTSLLKENTPFNREVSLNLDKIAKWYLENRRDLTMPELKQIINWKEKDGALL